MNSPGRRVTDRRDPVVDWATRAFALLILGLAFGARALSLVGETPLLVLAFIAGVVWKHESLTGALRAWRRNGNGAAPTP